MSKDETASPTPRTALGDGREPMPWSGLYIVCECGSVHQLESSDAVKEIPRSVATMFQPQQFEAPPCWTCGRVNVVADTPETRKRPPL